MRLLRFWPWFLLGVLTLVALLPWDPQGPFDARDYAPLPGVHLDYPLWGALFEPLLAPAQILTGAPDFRLALLSTAGWIAAVALIAGFLTGRGPWQRAKRTVAWPIFAVGALILYALVVATVHLPGWQLVVEDPDLVVADLQSHTFGSHDGLVTAEENLRWHRARGYDVVAVTEHKIPAGSFAAQAFAQAHGDLPGVIPGVEVRANEGEFLLGLGLRADRPVLLDWHPPQNYAREFVRDVHESHGGAVVALSWLLEPRHVGALAADGIDGIELVNTGHPDLPKPVRDAMLAHGASVLLLASTDWHGWGGFTRTWSLVKIPGAAVMDGATKASAVVTLLRARDQAAFTPVVAGEVGPPSTLRLMLSPWVESVRYAAELSPERVLSWWIWGAVVLLGVRRLRGTGVRPSRVFAIAAMGGMGLLLAARAAELLAYRIEGAPHEYAVEMGQPALAAGLVAIAVAAGLVWWERRRLGALQQEI